MTATKHDEGKSRLDLVPFDALLMVGHVLAFGANKYEHRGWEKGLDRGRIFAAAQRHLAQWATGQNNDPESGLSHVAHAACCCLMLLASELRGIGTDSRRP